MMINTRINTRLNTRMNLVHLGSKLNAFEPELINFMEGLVTPLSDLCKMEVNRVIKNTKNGFGLALGQDNLKTAIDVLYYLAIETEEAALRNIVQRAHDATVVGSATFVKNKGFKLNGASYILPDYNFNNGVNYTLNNASMGVKTNLQIDAGLSADIGGLKHLSYANLFTNGNSRINQPATGQIADFLPKKIRTSILSRISETQMKLNLDGSIQLATVNSSNIPDIVPMIGARSYGGTPDNISSNQFSLAFIGRAFSEEEETTIREEFNKYFGSISQPVLILGHRGSSDDFPENTIRAFRESVNEGANGIEIDVRKTSDGEFIVIHDSTLDRTTDGTGSVAGNTWDYISGLDAGSWKGAEFANQEDTKVPLLTDVLDEFLNADIYISVQCYVTSDINNIIDIIKAKGMLKKCFIFANRAYLGAAKIYEPECFVMNDGTAEPYDLIDQAVLENWNAVSLAPENLSVEVVKYAHDNGLLVEVSTITADYALNIEHYTNMGVDFILGNAPETMSNALSAIYVRQIKPTELF